MASHYRGTLALNEAAEALAEAGESPFDELRVTMSSSNGRRESRWSPTFARPPSDRPSFGGQAHLRLAGCTSFER